MLETLPCLPLFQDLNPEQVALLKPLFEQFSCPPGAMILEQGKPATHLYLLIRGEVAILYKPYDGPVITLTRLRDGDVFGWSAVVGSSCYTSSIVSETEVEAIRVQGVNLLRLLDEAPETGRIVMDRLARVVSSRWENAHAQVQALLNASQRQI